MIKLPDTDGLQDRVRLSEQTGPGPRLRAAREACGYEVEDIAKQLRLHPEIIRDLEKDTFADHLALVFVRGYLRAYANLIGLDGDQVVEEFNALGFKEERSLPDLKGRSQSRSRMRTEQEMQGPNWSPRFKWVAITMVIIALGGVFAAYNYKPSEQLYAPQVSAEIMQDTAEVQSGENLNPIIIIEGQADTGHVTTTPPARTTTMRAAGAAPYSGLPQQPAAPTTGAQDTPELQLPKPKVSTVE